MAIEFYLETTPSLNGQFDKGEIQKAVKLAGSVGLSLFAELAAGGGMLGKINKSNVMVRVADHSSLVYLRKFANDNPSGFQKARIAGVSTIVKDGKESYVLNSVFTFDNCRLSPGDIQVSEMGGFGGFWELYFEKFQLKIVKDQKSPPKTIEFDFKAGK